MLTSQMPAPFFIRDTTLIITEVEGVVAHGGAIGG